MLGRRSNDPMAGGNLIQTREMGRMRSGGNRRQGIAWIRIPAGARMEFPGDIRMVSTIRTIADEGLETSLCYNRLETGLEIRLALPSWQTNLVSPLESLLKA